MIMSFLHVVFFSSIILVSHFPGGSYSSNKNLQSSNLRDYSMNTTSSELERPHTHRKLLFQGESSCTSGDLSISQGLESSGSGTLPVSMVEIINTCESQSGCVPSNIHLHCGWFTSAKLVNPKLFKRLSYDDCLVNGGQRMSTAKVISFSYSSTSMYPISFKYATFCL